jgi:hypothetical protein
MQRLLASLTVVNPFAMELAFTASNTRARRDHKKYLGLIDAIALLHQHQRPTRKIQMGTGFVEYIEVVKADIETADMIAREVFGGEELPPQTRVFFMAVKAMVSKLSVAMKVEPSDVKFTQRMIREHTGMSASSVKRHLRTLVELEQIERLRGGPNKLTVYRYDPNWATQKATGPGLGHPSVGPVAVNDHEHIGQLGQLNRGMPTGGNGKSASYPQVQAKSRR